MYSAAANKQEHIIDSDDMMMDFICSSVALGGFIYLQRLRKLVFKAGKHQLSLSWRKV